MQTNAWKYGTVVLTALLLTSNAFWFYGAIDQGITASYREQTAITCARQADQLEVIANHFVAGKALSEVQPFLLSTASASEVYPKPEDQLMVIGDLALKLRPDDTVEALVRDP